MKKENIGFQIWEGPKSGIAEDKKAYPDRQSFKIVMTDTGEEYDLFDNYTYIGRSPENNICINSKTVSGKHCVLEKRGGTFFIRDLQSSNGTYINGERADDKEVALKNGDILGFADIGSRFVVNETRIEREAKIVSICSAEGGCGKTVLLLSLAKALSIKGNRVVYLDAENINVFQCFLAGNVSQKYLDSEKCLHLYETLSYRKLNSSVVKSSHGFDFFSPLFGSAEMNDIELEAYLSIAELFFASKEYDYILIDSDSQIGEFKTDLINRSDYVIVLRSDRKFAKEKEGIMHNILDFKNSKFIEVINEFNMSANYAQEKGFTVRNLDQFPEIEETKVVELSELICARAKNERKNSNCF